MNELKCVGQVSLFKNLVNIRRTCSLEMWQVERLNQPHFQIRSCFECVLNDLKRIDRSVALTICVLNE